MKSSYRRVDGVRRVDGERESETLFLLTRSKNHRPETSPACVRRLHEFKTKLVCYSTLMTAHFHRTRRKLVRGVRVHLEDKKRSQAIHSGHQRQQRLQSLHQPAPIRSSLNQLSQSP